jgi:diguanylate cyclase (GGDEF)-like protein
VKRIPFAARELLDPDVVRNPRYLAWERRHVRDAVKTGTMVLVVVLVVDALLMFRTAPGITALNVPFAAAGLALLVAMRRRNGPRRNPRPAAVLVGLLALASSLLPLVLVREAGPILIAYIPLEILAMALFVPWNHAWHAAWMAVAMASVVGLVTSPLGNNIDARTNADLVTITLESALVSFAGHHVLQRQRLSMFLQGMQVRRLNQLAAKQGRDLRTLADELRAIARVDSLTGVANRLRLDEDLAGAARRAMARDGGAALMVDIDWFKGYNDSNGHLAGDGVLRRVAAALTAQTRPSDRVYRYGGEEFLVLLPGATEAEAAEVGERQRQAVVNLAIPSGRPGAFADDVVTVSVGVVGIDAGRDETVDPNVWVKAADDAMYASKLAGRNQVTVAGRGAAAPDAAPLRDAVA